MNEEAGGGVGLDGAFIVELTLVGVAVMVVALGVLWARRYVQAKRELKLWKYRKPQTERNLLEGRPGEAVAPKYMLERASPERAARRRKSGGERRRSKTKT